MGASINGSPTIGVNKMNGSMHLPLFQPPRCELLSFKDLSHNKAPVTAPTMYVNTTIIITSQDQSDTCPCIMHGQKG